MAALKKRGVVMLMASLVAFAVCVRFTWHGDRGSDVAAAAPGNTDTTAAHDDSVARSRRSDANPHARHGDIIVNTATSVESAVHQTIEQCNRDVRNNLNRHVGCILIRNAVVTHQAVWYDPKQQTLELPRQFPPLGASRHHMTPIRLQPTDDSTAAPRATANVAEAPIVVGYFQGPVSGAQWENAWHTIADFFVMLFHTLAPLFNAAENVGGEAAAPVWFTRTARGQLRKGCSSGSECASLSLFDPFRVLFRDRVRFVEASMEPTNVSYLIIGLNTRCSPIPTENVGVPECDRNLWHVRETLLRLYGFPRPRSVTMSERQCPTIHLMSRQGDKYRHLTPFDTFYTSLQGRMATAFWRSRGCSQAQVESSVRVLKLTGRMSFREQMASVYNHSVLVAGRGGGTALSIFLPEGGLYISYSGFDKWSPYRDLIPHWISLQHVEVGLVHHEDWRRPPQWFGSGKARYMDPNRAAYYLAKPEQTAEHIATVIRQWAA